MTTETPTTEERIAPRTKRALEQYLTVLPDQGRARNADDLVTVTSESGSEYLVDLRTGTCECEDSEYRNPEGGCKHVRRANMATGRVPIPARACEQVRVDPQLGQHTEGSLKFVAADGGVIEADPDPEQDGDTPRAECWCAEKDLPCFEHFEREDT